MSLSFAAQVDTGSGGVSSGISARGLSERLEVDGLAGSFGESTYASTPSAAYFIPYANNQIHFKADPGFDTRAGYMSPDAQMKSANFSAVDMLVGSMGLKGFNPIGNALDNQHQAPGPEAQIDTVSATEFVSSMASQIIDHQQKVDPTVAHKFHDNAAEQAKNSVETVEVARDLKQVLDMQRQELDAQKQGVVAGANMQNAAERGGAVSGTVFRDSVRSNAAMAAVTGLAVSIMGPDAAAKAVKTAMNVAGIGDMAKAGITQASAVYDRRMTRAEADDLKRQEGYHTQRIAENVGGAPAAAAPFADAAAPELKPKDPAREMERLAEVDGELANVQNLNNGMGQYAMERVEKFREYFEANGEGFDLREMMRASNAGLVMSPEADTTLDKMTEYRGEDAALNYLKEIAADPHQYLELDAKLETAQLNMPKPSFV